jgi:hypothetical protein
LDNLNQDTTLKLGHLQAQAEEQSQSLSSSKVALVEYETIVDVLSKELGTAKARLEELSGKVVTTKEKTERLSAQLNEKTEEYSAANRQIDELHQSNHHWWSMTEQLGKELEEARSKIGELNQSSHQWWSEADRLSQQLHAVFSSKSWRITWPLRLTGRVLRWILHLPVRFARMLIRLFKIILRPIFLFFMRQILSRPGLKRIFNSLLKRSPLLHTRLKVMCSNAAVPTQNVKRYRTHNLDSAQFDRVKECHVIKNTETQKVEDNLEVFIGRIYDEIERKDNVDESPKKGPKQ